MKSDCVGWGIVTPTMIRNDPLRVVGVTRVPYLVALGIGVWFIGAISVLIGAQSVTGWLENSLIITTTVILGLLLLGRCTETFPASNLSHSRIISKHSSSLQTHRGVR